MNLSGEDTVGEVEEEQSPMEQVTETVIEATENITDIAVRNKLKLRKVTQRYSYNGEYDSGYSGLENRFRYHCWVSIAVCCNLFCVSRKGKVSRIKRKKSDELQLLDLSKEELENNIKDSEEISSEDVNDESDMTNRKTNY